MSDPGLACCTPLTGTPMSAEQAEQVAPLLKALADPVRVEILALLRAAGGEVCQCQLQPLFDISQPTLSHHLKKLRDAGIVGVERRGLWAYYFVHPHALEELSQWLS